MCVQMCKVKCICCCLDASSFLAVGLSTSQQLVLIKQTPEFSFFRKPDSKLVNSNTKFWFSIDKNFKNIFTLPRAFTRQLSGACINKKFVFASLLSGDAYLGIIYLCSNPRQSSACKTHPRRQFRTYLPQGAALRGISDPMLCDFQPQVRPPDPKFLCIKSNQITPRGDQTLQNATWRSS